MLDSVAPHSVAIRIAAPPDFDEVAAIWHSSASLAGVGPPQMPTLNELRSRVDVEAATVWKLFVAETGSRLVGILAIIPESQVLDQLFVRPGQIGAGIGRLLMDYAKAEMPSGFSLHKAATNERARAFYERAGMKLSRSGAHPRTGHPVVWYEWTMGN